ncbi:MULTISPECIES: CoA transferase [unclassified Frankia]|uniref:CaiB/BaiF CoA transferase family protein n=1 Tax=unclassified Frankia TaxID=2632575 RepID=UPI002AD27050|nr:MULTISPECIES: CoA transferase [unclassified Frankia]
MPAPLDGFRVLDLSIGIAGGYTTKLLADAGAEVVTCEDAAGDPLRRWSASGAAIAADDDGALFKVLAASKQSAVPTLEEALDLVRWADAIVWSPGSELAASMSPARVRELNPTALVLSITPFGLAGPWAGRPATEFTLQAISGGVFARGTPSRPPVCVGGRTGEWLSGMIGAVGLLASYRRRLRTGQGELLDLSMLESIVLTHTMYEVNYRSIAGVPPYTRRLLNFPGIERTKDGWVAFMVVTGQQWLDFCLMVERADWMDNESLIRLEQRISRRDELAPAIAEWMTTHTTDEVIEIAEALRVPVAPVGNGALTPRFDHLVANRLMTTNPRGGFVQPNHPYRFPRSSLQLRDFAPAPTLGEHTATVTTTCTPRELTTGTEPAALPFQDLRVCDLTAFWAGPIVGYVLAMLGADVIKVESVSRPDGMRMRGARSFREDLWWETGPSYHGGNAGKRGITLDLGSEEGRELLLELVSHSDVLVENFTPRVMASWGLTYDVLKAVRPDLIYARLPAFGSDGPWRDRSGYAQTIEAVSGIAWMTGYPDTPPQFANSVGDPLAGSHATIAISLALEHRRRTGEGSLIEAPMLGGALNICAEQYAEFSAYGALLKRDGNRSPTAAPQGLYLCADSGGDTWVAVSVETERQWHGLRTALGEPSGWDCLNSREQRRAQHDAIDETINAWTSARGAAEVEDVLVSHGVPAAVVGNGAFLDSNPQLQARGFFEDLAGHPVVGSATHSGYPIRFSGGPHPPVHRRTPPLLGEHNREVLGGLLGHSDAQLAAWEAAGVIGTKPKHG